MADATCIECGAPLRYQREHWLCTDCRRALDAADEAHAPPESEHLDPIADELQKGPWPR